MKDIRIGNDISVRWSLYKGDEAYDLTNLPVTLYLKNAYGKKKVEGYKVEGNQVSWTFYGKDQKNTGKYSMVLVVREGEQGMASTDYCDFVQLVSCACQVSGVDDENVQTETIELTSEVDFPPIIVDTALSESSLNPIANKAVAEKFAEVEGKMALQPDWNQSDPISKDYIKNRTHGIVFHGDPRKSNYNDFLKSLTNPRILHVGGNTIATFFTGYHSLYDYDTFLFQLNWGSTTDNILDGIIPTNQSVSVGASTSVVLTFKTFGAVNEDGEFVEHYQTTITFSDSEGWNVDEVISALCEQYCLLINEDFEIAKLDQRYIPETIARKSELLELLEDKANKDDIEQLTEELRQELTELSEEHNDLNYEVNATPHVMIGKYSTTTTGNKLSFIDYAPRSSTQLIPRYSDKFTIVGVDSIYDIIFLDKDNIVTRRNGAIRTFNEGEVAMVVIFINENNPNGYSQLRVLQGVTLTENLESVYKEMDIRSVMSGDSIKNVVLNGYYNTSGNFTSDDTYKALPLLPNYNNALFIDLDIWKVNSFGVRCLDADKRYIGEAVREEYEVGKIRYNALENTAYYGIYWNPKDASTDYSNHFIIGLQYPQLNNLLTGKKNENGDNEDADKLNLIDSIPSVNMYNPNDADAIEGAYISGDYVESNTSYDSSGYISVNENTVYYNAADSTKSFRFVNYYDENKNFIAKESDGTGLNLNSFTTPQGCAYIRVSVFANYERTHFVASTSANYTPYSPQLGTDGKKVATIDEVGNTLYGKKWCVVGDSFSADFPKGYADDWYYDNGTSKVYGRLIAKRNKMSLQWMAAGGRTIATPADGSFTNSFSLDLYKNIDADVDYITIYLGINDSHHAPGSTGDDGEDMSGEIPLGTINDTTNATFYGAWNVVIPYLIEKHPFAHIGIIVSNGCDTEEYREATIAIAKKYGIPYIDLNGDERTPFMIRSKNPNIPQSIRNLRTLAQAIDYDGSITGTPNSHPNKAAHEYESMFIENFLRSL